jgi:hypothetical protein
MNVTKILLAAGLAAAIATPANAGPLQKRVERQENRIEQGTESGALTDKEEKILDHHADKIGENIEKAKEDGEVTGKEARRIHRQQDNQSERIYHMKHNHNDGSSGKHKGHGKHKHEHGKHKGHEH